MNADFARPSPWQTYRRLLGHARRYRWYMAAAALGMLVEAGAAGYFTALMQPMVDETFVARNPDVRWTLPLTIVGLFVLRGIATFGSDLGMARTGQGMVRDLQAILFDKFLRLPSARYDLEPVGKLLSRLTYDTTQMAGAITEALKVMVTDTLTIAVMLGVMIWQSFTVTIAMLIVGPLIALISAYVSRRYRRINRNIQEAVARTGQASLEVLSGQQEVKVYGAQAQELARFRVLLRASLRLVMKMETTRAAASSTVQLLGACALAVILFAAGYEAARGRMSAGGFVVIMTSMMVMLPSLKRITNVQGPLQRGISSAERLFALLDEPDEADHGRRQLQRCAGEIEFRAVSIRYRGKDEPAVRDVSFRAGKGSVTAIVGRSGSGKTTLVRMLPRFYEPSSGLILLDGHPLGEYRLADLRRQIALVGQHPVLFDDTVAANIAYALGEVDPARIRAAADAANASEFIDRLPQGMQTRIGENGTLLSGGQRQRLAIARAVLKDAPILILDEATAALDNQSEQLVQEALQRLIPDRTTLVIAHRLSTIEHADQVLVMDEGRLVEQGTHAGLLARGGDYARLYRKQFQDADGGQGDAGAA